MTWLSFFLLLFGLSWAGVGLFRWYAVERGMLDQPNGRSSHIAPTARGGGVIFFVVWYLVLGILFYYHLVSKAAVYAFLPAFMVGFVGYLDDRKGLSALTRLFIHTLSAIGFLFILGEGGYMLLPWCPLPLPLCFFALVFIIVWMTNLYNFMDGSDGMAAMEAIFVLGMGGFFLFQYQAYSLCILAYALVALLTGFLLWNWPTARIFMGDSGSCFLGFIIISFALISYKYLSIPIGLWIILTGLFWFDATVTLLRRIAAREKWYKPHRNHAYQRLIQRGWSHQKVLLSAIVVNTILAGLALLAFYDPRLIYFSLSVMVVLLSCLYILVEIAKPMYQKWYPV